MSTLSTKLVSLNKTNSIFISKPKCSPKIAMVHRRRNDVTNSVLKKEKIRKSYRELYLSSSTISNRVLRQLFVFINENTGNGHALKFSSSLFFRALLNDHILFFLPAFALLLTNRKDDLLSYLQYLFNTFGSSSIIKKQIFRIIVSTLQIHNNITTAQARFLICIYENQNLNQNLNQVLTQWFDAFLLEDDYALLQKHLCELVTVNPLDPPIYSIHNKYGSMESLPLIAPLVIQQCIRIIAAFEQQKCSEMDCLDILFGILTSQSMHRLSHLQKSYQIPCIPLYFALYTPTVYPSTHIEVLLHSKQCKSYFTSTQLLQLLQLTRQYSIALYYAYLAYLHTNNIVLFYSLCLSCIQTEDNDIIIYLLQDENHARILYTIIKNQLLNKKEVHLIRKEYKCDDDNVFYLAFKLYEEKNNLDDFIIGLKGLVSVYSSQNN